MKRKILPLLAAVVCVLFVFTGCEEQEFVQKSYSADAESVRSLTLSAADREVEVESCEGTEIGIYYSESEKEHFEISLSEEGELVMSLVTDKVWTDYFGTKPSLENRRIRIRIPKGVPEDLSISVTNEKLVLSDVEIGGELSLSSNGGDISLNAVSVGKGLEASAKNGDIVGSLVGGWDDFSIDCKTKKGECNLPANKAGGEKFLRINCNNGDVRVEFIGAFAG